MMVTKRYPNWQGNRNNVELQSRDFRILGFLLLLGLVHGLVYIFLVPPWQHYDEPNHFEYVWLIQERGELPQSGDYDQSMRRDVAESMIEHGFFNGMDFFPKLDVQDEPIWIGSYHQISNPPFYYYLTTLPLKIFPIPPPIINIRRVIFTGTTININPMISISSILKKVC